MDSEEGEGAGTFLVCSVVRTKGDDVEGMFGRGDVSCLLQSKVGT